MSEIVFELVINLAETLIIIDFVTRYLGCKYEDKRKYIGFFSAWAVSFAELSVINYILPFEGVGVFIPIAINFLYALLFLKGSVWLKLWVSVLIEIIMMIIAIGTNLVVCQLIGYDPNAMITVFNSTRVISVIITKIMLFYTSRIILRHRCKNPIDNQAWFLLIIIPLISVISLSALMMAAMNHDEISHYIICGMIGILTANITTYYFFLRLNKNYETKLRLQILAQNNENTLKNLENANAFVQDMQIVRHDIKNQLTIISDYIKGAQYDKAVNYINDIIDSRIPIIQEFINSDNEVFDAIVNSKIAVCNSKNIYIEIKAMQGALNNIEPADIAVLFGNLLDNAIEAAQTTAGKRITVDIKQNGRYLSILVSNSIDSSILKKNSVLATTKHDKSVHGFGIKSIKNVVKKYDGMVQFFEENDEFCCHIMI